MYHVTDDYTAFGHLSDHERQAIAEAERELLAAADLTIVTAPRLLELKGPFAKKIAWVPNGVDYRAFQQAGALPLPSTAGPILGYSGHTSNRLDLLLLHALAVARPAWQFVFAGSVSDAGCVDELAALRALPNVHFLGLLPVEQVPQFTAACDVGLIPYRVNDETRAISSLKLYEFLAAGKPIVSARVPAAEEHAGVIFIVDSSVEAWIAGIEAALASSGDASAAAARQRVAAANTWEERVEQISVLVQDLSAMTARRSASRQMQVASSVLRNAGRWQVPAKMPGDPAGGKLLTCNLPPATRQHLRYPPYESRSSISTSRACSSATSARWAAPCCSRNVVSASSLAITA